MLNPKTIRHAKECIQLIKDKYGTRLMLSDPNFVQLLHGYVESADSRELGDAYARLISMAGAGFVMQNLEPRESGNVINVPYKKAVASSTVSTG